MNAMRVFAPFINRAIGFTGTMAFRSLIGSVDYKWAYYHADADPCWGKQHFILMFWHEHILCPLFFRRHSPVTMLASPHGDAEIVMQAADFLGMRCVRGSSYDGGTNAVRQMLALKEHDILAFTPDGPRGPRRTMAPGAIFLASKLQMPIVMLGVGYDRCWRMPTWDKFAVPKPWARGRIISSQLIDIPKKLSKSELERYRQHCENLLTELTNQAEDWAAGGYSIEGESIACMGPKTSLMYYGYPKNIAEP